MAFRFGIAVFPGTWSDRDFSHAVSLAGAEAVELWHADRELKGSDCVVLPGGFAYGDYLRAGAIARFAPLMGAVQEHARQGGLVLGSCNGFQILCEAGMLPGALLRNRGLRFRCQPVRLRIESSQNPFLGAGESGQLLTLPISHGEGCYYAPPEEMRRLNQEERVVLRYCDEAGEVSESSNPNGSLEGVAGILSPGRNVLGLMPHPERACEPILGSSDGLLLLRSLIEGQVKAGR